MAVEIAVISAKPIVGSPRVRVVAKGVGRRKRCWPGTNHRGFGLALKKYQIELLGVITRLPDFCVMNSIRQFDGNTYNSKIIKVKYRNIY